MSTMMFRQRDPSNKMSLMVLSQLRSKLMPTRCPMSFNAGEPELPPVVWLDPVKHTTRSPSSLA